MQLFKIFPIGNAKVELNISSTIFARETVNGSCIFSGASKPRYIHVRIMVENDCTIRGATAFGLNINNFHITYLSSGMSFGLGCYISANNGNEKIVKQIEGNNTVSFW